jgi:hypothetical protein
MSTVRAGALPLADPKNFLLKKFYQNKFPPAGGNRGWLANFSDEKFYVPVMRGWLAFFCGKITFQ